MQSKSLVLMTAFVVASIMTGTALADSPHFISAGPSLTNSGSLVVSFNTTRRSRPSAS
jgi:hypothetical protein